jgi:hypothetical protein
LLKKAAGKNQLISFGKCEGVRNRFPRMEAMAHPLVAFSAFLGGEV